MVMYWSRRQNLVETFCCLCPPQAWVEENSPYLYLVKVDPDIDLSGQDFYEKRKTPFLPSQQDTVRVRQDCILRSSLSEGIKRLPSRNLSFNRQIQESELKKETRAPILNVSLKYTLPFRKLCIWKLTDFHPAINDTDTFCLLILMFSNIPNSGKKEEWTQTSIQSLTQRRLT